jgi:hypothetical protein
LEYGASHIRSFESLLIPGLLQSSEYIRAVLGADPQYSPVELEQRVAIRRKRQERLRGADPLRLSYILSEGALRQHVGGPEVQHGQLQDLASSIEELWETVEVRVVRFDADIGPLANASTLMIVDFPSPHLDSISWQESIRPLGVIDDPERIRRLELSWQAGKSSALDRSSSLDFVRAVAGEMKKVSTT